MEKKPSLNSLGTRRQAALSSAPEKDTTADRKLRSGKVQAKPMENRRPARPKAGRTMVKKEMEHDTPLSLAFRHIVPSWRHYIGYVRQAVQAGDEKMERFLKVFDRLPKGERRSIMPEDVCDLAGILQADLISAVSRWYWQIAQCESVIFASSQHAKMLQATAFWGQSLADCAKDRELFFRATGGLPDKKGSSIIINAAPSYAVTTVEAGQQTGVNGFRSMDQRVVEMGRVLEEPEPVFSKDTASVFTGDHRQED